MTIVVDANVLIVAASGDPRRPLAQAWLRVWTDSGEDLHAPDLLTYEVASGLTRLVAARVCPAERLAEAWQTVLRVPIIYHPMRDRGDEITALALRLNRKSAYDAAYLLLAQQLGADLWSFDGPLARNAAGLGFPVHLIT